MHNHIISKLTSCDLKGIWNIFLAVQVQDLEDTSAVWQQFSAFTAIIENSILEHKTQSCQKIQNVIKIGCSKWWWQCFSLQAFFISPQC